MRDVTQIETRLTELKRDHEVLQRHIESLEREYEQSCANLNVLNGAIQALEEVLQLPTIDA